MFRLQQINKFILLICALPAISGCYNSADDMRLLTSSHFLSDAYIVHLDCGDHGAVYYGFRVNQNEYRGKSPSGLFNCNAVKIGDKTPIYYHPENPQIHSLIPPKKAYENAKGWYIPELFWYIGMPILLTAFTIFSGVLRRKSKS